MSFRESSIYQRSMLPSLKIGHQLSFYLSWKISKQINKSWTKKISSLFSFHFADMIWENHTEKLLCCSFFTIWYSVDPSTWSACETAGSWMQSLNSLAHYGLVLLIFVQKPKNTYKTVWFKAAGERFLSMDSC